MAERELLCEQLDGEPGDMCTAACSYAGCRTAVVSWRCTAAAQQLSEQLRAAGVPEAAGRNSQHTFCCGSGAQLQRDLGADDTQLKLV